MAKSPRKTPRPGRRVWLLAPGLELSTGLAESLSLEALAAEPRWRIDLDDLGPWGEAPADVWGLAGTLPSCRISGGAGQVLVCGPCPSCLDVMWRLLQTGALPDWSSVLAVSQTSGRGQYRREWASPAGNVFAAWLPPQELSGGEAASERFAPQLTPLLAGAMLAAGLEAALDGPAGSVSLKWPNDLLFRGGKAGGILVEERHGRCVVGVGLNLAWAPGPEELRQDWAAPAARLVDDAPGLGPLGLWLRTSAASREFSLARVTGRGGEELAGLVQERLAWRGREACVVQASLDNGQHFDRLAGIIIGVATDGALRLDVRGQELRVVSESVSCLPSTDHSCG